MNIKLRLTIMSFFQFFVWGSWLITIGAYWFQTKQWSGAEFGAIFSTMGIASLFMPAITGNYCRQMGKCGKAVRGTVILLGGIVLLRCLWLTTLVLLFWVMLLT